MSEIKKFKVNGVDHTIKTADHDNDGLMTKEQFDVMESLVGEGGEPSVGADKITYDNSTSGSSATNVQDELDSLETKLGEFNEGESVSEKLSELEGETIDINNTLNKNLKDDEFTVVDKTGNAIAVINKDGLTTTRISVLENPDDNTSSKDIVEWLNSKADKDDSIIADDETFAVIDKDGHIAFKIDKYGNVDYNGKGKNEGSRKLLEGYTLFSLGDSLSVGGVW